MDDDGNDDDHDRREGSNEDEIYGKAETEDDGIRSRG